MPYGFWAQGSETKGWPVYRSLPVTLALTEWPRFIICFRCSFWFSLPSCSSHHPSSFVVFRIYACSLCLLRGHLFACDFDPEMCKGFHHLSAAVREDVWLVSAESSVGAVIEAHSEIFWRNNIQLGCSLFTRTVACIYYSSWRCRKVCKERTESLCLRNRGQPCIEGCALEGE